MREFSILMFTLCCFLTAEMCRKEVLIHGQYKGALTWAFLEALRKNVLNGNSNPSYIRLLADLRAELETSKYRNIWKTLPKPQLSSSHKMGMLSRS